MALPASCSSSCVKLYLCSNPENSVVERKALREEVFPTFREYCRHALGQDVRVIDPFESSDRSKWPDAKTRKQLIKECRESSTGPFLLALVGHEYGTVRLPAQIEVSEYQLLLQESQRAGVSTVELEKVYSRNENTIPPSYCLKSQVEMNQQNVCKYMIQTAVSLCVLKGQMTPEQAQDYLRSALDVDLRYALEDKAHNVISGRCLVYIHKVTCGKEEKERDAKLHQESESEGIVMCDLITPETLLSALCDGLLLDLAISHNLLVYTTTTECPHGYTAARRSCYAQSLCPQVHSDLVKLTSHCCTEALLGDAFARELAEQEELCMKLSDLYEIIRPEEDEIRNYVQNEQWRPLVVTGGPCTGKTVLLAHCSQQIESWLQDSDPVVIPYFCSLSVNPSPKHLLSSLCYQITRSYRRHFFEKQDLNLDTNQQLLFCSKHSNSSCNLDVHTDSSFKEHVFDNKLYSTEADMSLSGLKQHLLTLMSSLPSPKHLLVFLLDGLDQIDYNLGLHVIESLPSPLPASVKLLFTVSSKRKHIVQALELHYPQCSPLGCTSESSGLFCLQLGLPNRKQCVKMLASLLSSSGRRITSGQQALVNQALTSCCLPLYTHLLHWHVSLWHSDSEVTESTLSDGVHSSISTLLDHLELKHGVLLVAQSVCYLTLSKTGLTEAELTDLLSNDNKVLAEYTKLCEGCLSKMRVPQVDVERLILDLKPFLIRQTVAGSQVLFWTCRHFGLVITKRYLGTPTARSEFHSEMVDYFSGRWSCGCSKPLQDSSETKIYVDRQPSSQPFFFTSSSKEAARVNLRKILELPYHMKEGGRFEEQRKLVLTLDFQQAMVRAGWLSDLVAMLDGKEGFFKEHSLLANILKSSTYFLNDCPLEIPTVMELTLLPYKDVLPELKGYVNEIKQEKKRRGLRVALHPAPSTVPSFKCIKTQAEYQKLTEAVVCQSGVVVQILNDGSVWVWKSTADEFVRLSLTSVNELEEIKFGGIKSSGQFILLTSFSNKHFLWDVSGTDFLLEVKDSSGQTAKIVDNFFASPEKICIQWKDAGFVSVFIISSSAINHFHCQHPVTSLACSSELLFCGQDEGTVSIFNTSTNCLLGTCSNSNKKTVVLIITVDDKQQMGCLDNTGNVTLWDISPKAPRLIKETCLEAKSDDVLNTDCSCEMHTLLVCQSQQVTLWDTLDWEKSDQFLAPNGRTFTQALLSQDGHLFLALLDTSSSVLVWRLGTGDCVLSLKTSQVPLKLFNSTSEVFCVSQDGSFTSWYSEMIHAAGIAPKMGCGVKEVVVEQDGNGFFTSDGSPTVWKWSMETGQPYVHLLHNDPVEKMHLSLDNVHLVTLSSNDIYIWQTGSGQNTMRISGSRTSDILITPNSNFGVNLCKHGLSRVWKLMNGAVVCTMHLYLSNAQISAESTFLIGLHCGKLLAASLWTGVINKRFSCNERSENIVAFQTLSKHPGFAIVLLTSGSLYTWNVAEETVFLHFKIPLTHKCQPKDFQMSCNGSYALLSTDNEKLTILDLSQFKVCSFRASGDIIKASLDTSGCYIVCICSSSLEKNCDCCLHTRPVLTLIRLKDGKRVSSLYLPRNPLSLAVYMQQCVVVGFEDGAVGVYNFIINGEQPMRRSETLRVRKCPLDQAPRTWLPLKTPNILWS